MENEQSIKPNQYKIMLKDLLRRFHKVSKMSPPNFENKEHIILRDFLALERTKLANERTLLAYIRASIYLVLGGIAFMQLEGFDNIQWIGPLSIALSAIFVIIGIFRFVALKMRLTKFYTENKSTNDAID